MRKFTILSLLRTEYFFIQTHHKNHSNFVSKIPIGWALSNQSDSVSHGTRSQSLANERQQFRDPEISC